MGIFSFGKNKKSQKGGWSFNAVQEERRKQEKKEKKKKKQKNQGPSNPGPTRKHQ